MDEDTLSAGRQATPPVVAVINTSTEIVDLLCEVLAEEGFAPVSALTLEFKRGERDLRTFVAEHRPQVILWDIAIPYVENWEYFRDHALSLGLLPERCFVCSTVNKTALDMLVGPTPAIELIGRPFDLDVITDAVRRALNPSD
jgi:hypothetical protein